MGLEDCIEKRNEPRIVYASGGDSEPSERENE